MSSLSLSRHLSLAAIAVAALVVGAAPAQAEHDDRARPAPVVVAPAHGFAVGFGSPDGSFFVRVGDGYRDARRDCSRPSWRSAGSNRWRRAPARACEHRFKGHECGLCGFRDAGYRDYRERYDRDRYERDRYERDHCEHGRDYRDGCDRCNYRVPVSRGCGG